MNLDPNKAFEEIKSSIIESVGKTLPISNRGKSIEAEDIWVEDDKDLDDYAGQKKARLQGKSWAVPMKARLALKDDLTGKVIQRKTLKIADIPKLTKRYGYIHAGSEYQTDNRLNLREGVYSRERKDGTLASEFHLKGKPFNIVLDPKKKKFQVKIGTATPDLYPILKSMGVPDSKLEKSWGKEILEANKKSDQRSVKKMYKAYTGTEAKDLGEATQYIIDRFKGQALDPRVTKITLGKEYNHIQPDTLVDASNKLLGISKGEKKEDNRDSLLFKKIKWGEDHFKDAIDGSKRSIEFKAKNHLGHRDDIRKIIPRDLYQKIIDRSFTQNSSSNTTEQVNPAEFLSNYSKATVLGEGGLSSEEQAFDEMKYIDPSHIGVLDPLHTPEGSRTGLTLHLTQGVRKKGDSVAVSVYNPKEKKLEQVDLYGLRGKKIALPGQLKLKPGGGVAFKKSKAQYYDIEEGVKNEIPTKDIDYALVSPEQAMSNVTNLIPFAQNNNPVRATTAGRQMEQALPLEEREAPLVQVKSSWSSASNEKAVGNMYSHSAPTGGKVKKVTPSKIIIEDKEGKEHKVQLYNNFPLNMDKYYMDSTPLVEEGDTVKPHQVIADSNFTDKGVLALGNNLDVGYMNYKGLNYEDGVVVSETGAKKLTSGSLHKKSVKLNKEDKLSKKSFSSYFPKYLDKEKASKLDDDGVIKKGQLVKPGDTLITALKKSEPTTESKMLGRLHKSLVKPFKNGAVEWDGDTAGIVTDVVKGSDGVKVFVRAEKPAEVGDKVVGRYGNKGIVTKIIPDKEMPQVKDKPLDLLMAPNTVPGRINLGQVFETAVSKIAEKTGKPYTVDNFSDESTIDKIKKDLKKHGLSDKEAVYDPQTNRKLGDILAGKQYIFKLKHEVKKKSSSRGGGPGYAYDLNKIPKGGGAKGAMSLGNLGLYGLLAAGAKANLREMHTWKTDSNQSDDVWTAIQSGLPLPAPKTTFANEKFHAILRGAGVDVQKKGKTLTTTPLTDKQVLAMSSGEIKDPGRMVMGADATKPDKGGLFDKKVTGGLDGKKWSHITLKETMPNPLFEAGITTLLDLKNKDYQDIVSGEKAVDGKYGGEALKSMLNRIDVDKELKKAKNELPKLGKSKLSKGYKKYRYLKALKEADIKPSDAYLMKHVPVLPPKFRPLALTNDGRISRSDLNDLYKGVGLISQKLGEMNEALGPDESNELRSDLYNGLKALTGAGSFKQLPYRGLIDIVQGKRPNAYGTGKVGSPKEGFFQDKLLGTKQDLTVRSTITPNPNLGLDEIGVPEKKAMEMMKPFVVADIKKSTGLSPLKAQDLIKKDDPIAKASLQRVVKERPVIMKRDPVLHKYGLQGFKPKLIKGRNIEIHPLTTTGFNADFDGDAVNLFAPISKEAVNEVYKMMPSNNLFSMASNSLMYVPNKEMQTGLYLASRKGKRKNKSFKTVEEAEAAWKRGDVVSSDEVKIGGKWITVGRAKIAKALPDKEKQEFLKLKTFDKKEQKNILSSVAKRDPYKYGEVADKLKNIGNDEVTYTAFSIGLDDFAPEKKIRDSVLNKAESMFKKLPKSKQTKEKKWEMYDAATMAMLKKVDQKKSKNPDSTFLLQKSGVKPGPDQYRQLLLAPMLVKKPTGEIEDEPIKRSYSEGLGMGDYFKAAAGARRGIVEKVQSVQDPGALTKSMMNSVLNEVVVEDDCEMDDGISLDLEDGGVYNRILAKSVKAGNDTIPKGTTITPEVEGKLRANKVKQVNVLSPLKCTHGTGICPKCWGLDENGKLPDVGRNLGVESAHALGERSTQLALKAFHGGGVVSGGKAKPDATDLQNSFARVNQLLTVPKNLPDAAPLAVTSGKVNSIKKSSIGGFDVDISGSKHHIPAKLGPPKLSSKKGVQDLKPGMEVKKGDALAPGPINPHDLLKYKGVRATQRYISDGLYSMYKGEGVDRRAAEMVTRSITNTAQVEDPGDVPGVVRGDLVPYNSIKKMNRSLPEGGKKMKAKPVLKGVNEMPLYKMEDWLARMNHTRLQSTVEESALQGWSSYLGEKNPIPALIEGKGFGRGKFY